MVWAVLNEEHNIALRELIQQQTSDRVVAVIGGAMIDDSLRRALEFRLRPKQGQTDMNERLFRANGPLGNIVPKIDLAYQLYLFEKPTRNALWGLSRIRNYFAHHLSASFPDDDKDLRAHFDNLTLHIDRTHYPTPVADTDSDYPLEYPESPRDVFIVNLKLCLIFLMSDHRRHVPYSMQAS